MKILFSIIGLIVGAVIDRGDGAFFGFFIGLLAGTVINYNDRLRKLEAQLNELKRTVLSTTTSETVQASTPAPPPEAAKARDVIPEEDEEEDVTLIPLDPGFETVSEQSRTPSNSSRQDNQPEEPITIKPTPGMIDTAQADDAWQDGNSITGYVKRFFTSGNVVVKVGVILLLFGVSFLLKLDAVRNLLPVEFWLSLVAVGAIVLLIIGWKLRTRREKYALVLQGGAVGILYITVFSAIKLNALMSLGFAFVLMVLIVLLSSFLSVIQNSRSLAVFAIIGGFLAPILTSSGSGNHVALFSYYALLNLGILFIAWHKSWRILNWLGFVFTFVIASLWGIEYYQPDKFATTEPFLILFFVYYVVIAILYAHRQPPKLRGIVDGSLVFGTPLVGFTLQTALVRNFEYGMTWSALALAVIYVLLSRVFWQRRVDGMRMLCESFLSIGVIFISLVIPLTLEGRWTAAAWALEGAGIAWIGIRQQRVLPRAFGLFLQFAASLAFLSDFKHPHADYAILNAGYIGAVMISISALFLGLQYYRHRDRVLYAARDVQVVLLTWGLLWWFGAGLVEIEHHVLHRYEFNSALLFIALSFWLVFILARTLRWTTAEKAPIVLLPIIYLFAVMRFFKSSYTNPFIDLGYLGWIAAFVVQYGLLYRADTTWRRGLLEYWHALTTWVYVFMATWIIANGVSTSFPDLYYWGELLWGVIPAIGFYKLIYFRKWNMWPLQAYRNVYYSTALFPIAIYLLVWVIVQCHQVGNPYPLPYVPVLNPQDIAQLFVMLAVFEWLVHKQRGNIPAQCCINLNRMFLLVALTMFIWINALVAHAVHYYGGVYYEFDNMFNSEVFQTAISIVWTITAFILMGVATRNQLRKVWVTGVILLGAVVIKLFIVDLDGSGTIARIVSFISTGVLMLVIGYVAPIPPKDGKESTKSGIIT